MTAPCPEEECDATFTGSRAHIDVVEHFSAVHIHGTVASEPAEPTTRPQADVIDKAADAIRDAYEVYAPVPGVLRSEAPNIARALADLGLLADPAQTTELEELRAQRHGLWELLKKSVRVTQVVLSTKIPRWDEDNVVAKFGWREGRCGKCGEDLPVTTEERDRLSLLLRGMARRTHRFRLLMNVNYREVCDAKDVIDKALAERDERQAEVERLRAELKAATDARD